MLKTKKEALKLRKNPEIRKKGESRVIYKVLFLILIAIFIFSILPEQAEALNPLTGGFTRIANFFQNDEYKQYNKVIDFVLFFVIFFAMAYLAFSKWFGSGFGKAGPAKGAVVGASLAVALMFSFAIVTQTKFSITTMFPIAKYLLFVILWILVAGLLQNLIETKTWLGKIVVAILGFVIVYLMFNMANFMICASEVNDANVHCQKGAFNALGGLWDEIFSDEPFRLENIWERPHRGKGGPSKIVKKGKRTAGTPGAPGAASVSGLPVCGIDGLFAYKSDDATAHVAAVVAFGNQFNEDKKLYIYGFASEEGTRSYNQRLSEKRAAAIEKILEQDPGMKYIIKAKPRGLGETKEFGALPDNRKFIITTEPKSKRQLEAGQYDSALCAALVKPVPKPPTGPAGPTGTGSWWSWWYLIPLIILLLFGGLIYRGIRGGLTRRRADRLADDIGRLLQRIETHLATMLGRLPRQLSASERDIIRGLRGLRGRRLRNRIRRDLSDANFFTGMITPAQRTELQNDLEVIINALSHLNDILNSRWYRITRPFFHKRVERIGNELNTLAGRYPKIEPVGTNQANVEIFYNRAAQNAAGVRGAVAAADVPNIYRVILRWGTVGAALKPPVDMNVAANNFTMSINNLPPGMYCYCFEVYVTGAAGFTRQIDVGTPNRTEDDPASVTCFSIFAVNPRFD